MNFNTQPSGFEFVAKHELQLPKAIFLPVASCMDSVACLYQRDLSVLIAHTEVCDGESIIDHPIMTIAK